MAFNLKVKNGFQEGEKILKVDKVPVGPTHLATLNIGEEGNFGLNSEVLYVIVPNDEIKGRKCRITLPEKAKTSIHIKIPKPGGRGILVNRVENSENGSFVDMPGVEWEMRISPPEEAVLTASKVEKSITGAGGESGDAVAQDNVTVGDQPPGNPVMGKTPSAGTQDNVTVGDQPPGIQAQDGAVEIILEA